MKAIRKHSIGMTHGNNVGAMISGKQLELRQGLNMAFHGSRLYFADLGRFATADIFSDRFHWLSPWTYCAANPINLTDPSGNIIAKNDVSTFNAIESKIRECQESYQKDIDNPKTNDKNRQKASYIVAVLQTTLDAIDYMRTDQNMTYSTREIGPDEIQGVEKTGESTIEILCSDKATAAHEFAHIGQAIARGGLKFSENKTPSKMGFAPDLKDFEAQNVTFTIDEINAYITQGAVDKGALPFKKTGRYGITKIEDITIDKLRQCKQFQNSPIYNLGFDEIEKNEYNQYEKYQPLLY